MRALWILLLVVAPALAAPGWPRARGPAHGRAHVATAPKPPLKLAWKVRLWDRIAAESILFEPGTDKAIGSPLALGIAWRADDRYLYAFETGFYDAGRKVALFDRKTGAFVTRASSKGAQPCANKRAFSLHEDCGFGPFLWFGGFYAGTPLMAVEKSKFVVRDNEALGISVAGHACEGTRWLMGRLYLDGGGARLVDGPQYFWGHDLAEWRPGQKPRAILKDVSVPCAAWDARGMVLYTRGDLSEATPQGRFGRHEYVEVSRDGTIGARRAVKNVFREPLGGRMLNRGRNAVHAIALAADGEHVFCHERVGAGQRIVRRRRKDFGIDGGVRPQQLPRVTENGFAGQINPELGIGMAADELRVYLHRSDRVEAYSQDFQRRLFSRKTAKRTLNAHTPFAMTRYLPRNLTVYGCRGTENTIATDGVHLYLTTDTTFEVRSCKTGQLVWSHTFEKLPVYEVKAGGRWQAAAALPGDVIVMPDAVYVATHEDQSMLFCFKPAE
ncbi:MAG: hypothetical protein OER88_09295 [Planctomycetota bacterium]|nr:hypothetical protein [Planctomycetota bacterium]